ncbi:MAG: SH3 domain-containing protein, partial [Thermomicrobiales bacterium]
MVVAFFCATLFAPVSALADTNLAIGGPARIAHANGDDVRVRETPAFEGAIVRYLPEGTVVNVVDGPVDGLTDGVWFKVSFENDTGYIVSDYLALSDGAAAGSPTPATDAQANPEGQSIGTAMIAGTNGDGVRCRVQADAGSAVITVVPEGSMVDLIGAAADVWQPINCGGQSGFVHSEFVTYDLSGGAAKPAAADPA